MAAEEIAALARMPGPGEGPMRFVSSGRLLHWKGFHLALDAFAEAAIQDAEFWVVGDGPERERLQAQAERRGIASRVRFLGKIPRAEMLETLRDCHVLVHPSLHDSGGWVCLEAMAAGRPVLCLDLGGPATQVTEAAGIKVAALEPRQAVRDLARAMRRLAADPALRADMGAAGRTRVCRINDWRAKGRALVKLYEQHGDKAPA